MKALKMLLKSEGVDVSSLRVLFEQDGATTFALTSDGWDVLDLWLKLRDLVPRTGRWPLLIDDDYPTNRAQFYADGKEPVRPHYRTFLEKAEGINFEEWLRKRHESRLEMVRDYAALDEPERDDEEVRYFRAMLKGDPEFHGLDRGRWPKQPSPYEFEGIAAEEKFDFEEGMTAKEVTLALLPAAEGWKAPAYWKWGSWNGNPDPEEHCAALRYWEGRCGAELVAMTKDTLEPRALRPPTTRKEAMRLAKDHYAYSPDRIAQMEGTLEKLAARLLGASAWVFWWD
jgi:hypothetical protein